MPLTRELGAFIAAISFEDLPPEAVDVARLGFIDTIGTMIAGSRDEAPQLLRKALAPPPGPATLYFTGETAPAPEAAWINGTAAHALDYDDVAVRGHPSTVLVPAILAEGEALGSSGADMIAAYVAGYEVWAELSGRDPAISAPKAGIRPAFSARSPPPRPAAGCTASTRKRRRWRLACRPRKPAGLPPISAR